MYALFERLIDWWIDFKGISTGLGLFYATFLCNCLRIYFLIFQIFYFNDMSKIIWDNFWIITFYETDNIYRYNFGDYFISLKDKMSSISIFQIIPSYCLH